ncbi:putative disease resistance protein [Acorus gramineus]|uniref:Disease resistance protein n=1 Tax=Acorus gramineus TaxID=55184 RepID=A0AAV9A4I8_ACOGR|nr:putative disease resistance protein [Acorus gramineus]
MPQPRMRSYISEDDVTIIGLYGPEGVGKTTRLKMLNNDFVRSSGGDFDSVIYVDVTGCSNDAWRIQEAIGGRLGLRAQDNESKEQIRRCLSHTSFLLILDDVRVSVNYEALVVPCDGEPHRQKIVVATPFDYMRAHMWAEETIEVKGLGAEEAWKLFVDNVGRDAMRANGEVRGLAEAVVRNCGGAPGKVIERARALAGKRTITEWRRVVSEKGMLALCWRRGCYCQDIIDVIPNIQADEKVI